MCVKISSLGRNLESCFITPARRLLFVPLHFTLHMNPTHNYSRSPILNALKSEFLHSDLAIYPSGCRLRWDGSGELAQDSRNMWITLGVMNTGEAVCYLCPMPRAEYGRELGHLQFTHSSLFDLACRYLTTLFDLHLAVLERRQRGLKELTLRELHDLRLTLTDQHGSIRFPEDVRANPLAQSD